MIAPQNTQKPTKDIISMPIKAKAKKLTADK